MKMETAGIKTSEATIKTAPEIGKVERCHPPFARRIRKRSEVSDRCDRHESLLMAVFEINCNIGLGSLCSVLLVFGDMPRPTRSTLSPTLLERQKDIEAGMKEVKTIYAKRSLDFDLKINCG